MQCNYTILIEFNFNDWLTNNSVPTGIFILISCHLCCCSINNMARIDLIVIKGII